MKYLLRLSGEHPRLPYAELEVVLMSTGFPHKLEGLGDRYYLLETDALDFYTRPAYVKKIYEYVGSSKKYVNLVGDIYDLIQDHESYRIESKSMTVQKKLGDKLRKLGVKVNLRCPEVVVGCHKIGEVYHVGLQLPLPHDFNDRKPQNRPFFHPTSMHPKLARCLVNLTSAPKDSTILDPFCGTGGILLEAGLMGLDMEGWDIDSRMVAGCKSNLRYYGLEGRILEKNALMNTGECVDYIVTDPPYGRSSYSSIDSNKLLKRFLDNACEMMDDESVLVIVSPNDFNVKSTGFTCTQSFEVRIHKSLTRKLKVLKKKIK